jgi:hypothetical protein
MIPKVSLGNRRRGRRGRLTKTISDRDARRILATYQQTRSIEETGRIHGGRAGTTIWALLKRRGLIKSRKPSERKIRGMYRAYCNGLSLEGVGQKYGRTRQAVFGLFKVRGLELRAKEFLPFVVYKGRKYTDQKIGGRYKYLRDTIAGRTKGCSKSRYLHHVVWEEHNGPVPPGHKVCFRDGNHLNCALENLMLLTNDEQQQWRGRKGQNQFTTTAGARLKLLVGNFESGASTLSTHLKARAA